MFEFLRMYDSYSIIKNNNLTQSSDNEMIGYQQKLRQFFRDIQFEKERSKKLDEMIKKQNEMNSQYEGKNNF